MNDTPNLEMPDWLQPFKREWLSMGSVAKLMQFEGRPFSSWFLEVKPRLRSLQVQRPTGMATLYLVKHVWACARAHGLTILPTEKSVPPNERIADLERAVNKLQNELIDQERENQKIFSTLGRIRASADEATLIKDLLAVMVRVSEPRPAPGVYFLLSQAGEITYVGRSKNVLSRMSGHAEKKFHSVRMIEVANDNARADLEMRLIQVFRPRDNIVGKSAA